MNPREIELYGLIGLRALAEYDLAEYRRAVDMSKQQLERKIESGLLAAENAELRHLYDSLMILIDSTENQVELSYLLQQVYTSSSIRAHFYSMKHRQARTAEASYELPAEHPESQYDDSRDVLVSHATELVRLSVMCLLRQLRAYVPMFNMHVRGFEVDCVLEPKLSDLPHIVVEAKTQTPERTSIAAVIKQLRSIMSAYGRKTIGVVIVEHRLVQIENQSFGKDVYGLVFDIRRNRFVGQEVGELVRRVMHPG